MMKKSLLSVWSMTMGAVAGAVASVAVVRKRLEKTVKKKQQLADKHLTIMKVYDEWLKVRQDSKSLIQYFEKRDYKNIAIYGMSYLGESIVRELKDSDVNVLYGIDKNAENIYSTVEVMNLSDNLPKVDVVVVTAVFFFDEIAEELKNMMNCPIISLEAIIYEVQG
jgi:hypothetical protein